MENYLKKIRLALGWTQEQMGTELRKSTTMVRYYERGAFVAPAEVAEKVQEIADANNLGHLIPRPSTEPLVLPDFEPHPRDYEFLEKVFPGLGIEDLDTMRDAWFFFRDAPDEVTAVVAAAIDAWLETSGRHARKQVESKFADISEKEVEQLEDLLYLIRRGEPSEVRDLIRRASGFRRQTEESDRKSTTEVKGQRRGRR